MYEKILAQLAAKHSGVSKVVLGLIAKKLAEKVTEESQIEGAITEYETNSTVSIKDYADLLQSETDKRVTEALKKKNEPTPPTPPAPSKDDNPDDVSSIVAKAVAEALKPFQSMASTLQNSQRIANLKAKLKAKDIDDSWADDVVFGDDYDEAATVERLETKWNNTVQAAINKQVADGKLHVTNSSTEASDLQAIKDYAKDSSFTKEAGYNIQEV